MIPVYSLSKLHASFLMLHTLAHWSWEGKKEKRKSSVTNADAHVVPVSVTVGGSHGPWSGWCHMVRVCRLSSGRSCSPAPHKTKEPESFHAAAQQVAADHRIKLLIMEIPAINLKVSFSCFHISSRVCDFCAVLKWTDGGKCFCRSVREIWSYSEDEIS